MSAPSLAVPASHKASAPMRIAVVGAGVAGATFARQIKSLMGDNAQLSLFEMGRGPGGRAATRRDRNDTRMSIDHGAPVFDVNKSSKFYDVAEALVDEGYLQKASPWWRYHARTTDEVDVKLAFPSDGYEAYLGKPSMNAMCKGLLAGVDISTHFGTKVSKLSCANVNSTVKWNLKGAGATPADEPVDFGDFDYLVVTSLGFAHATRWRDIFGEEAPVVEAWRELSEKPPGTSEKVDSLLASVERVDAIPVISIFAQYSADAAASWLPKAEFETLRFAPHGGALNKIFGGGYQRADGGGEVTSWTNEPRIVDGIVVRRRENGDVTLACHASEEYSRSSFGVYGTGSTASRLGAGTKAGAKSNDPRTEQEIVRQVLDDVAKALHLDDQAKSDFVKPTNGPFMQRWGSAFPVASTCISAEGAFAPESGLILAGDFTSMRPGTIEGAAESAIDAATKLASHVISL